MIIYFADRAMNILGSASTGLPKGLMITDDKKTEEISEGVATFECNLDYDSVNSDEEQEVDVKKLAAVGNFILKQSADSSEVEVYTIIDSTIDPIQKDASIYAEDAGLDLLNEVVGKYAADKAYNIAYYINKFAYDSGFEIGINEVSNLTRKLSWDGETTATERLLSVATQFDNAEIEFSFKVENMAVTGKYINVYKNRGNDSGVTLTVGKEISGFRIKSSIADLATAYRCTGGTPEGSENPITLNGYKYDDGDFYVEGSYVKSRKALEKWSRYQIKTEKNKNDVGHIVKAFSYDTTSKSELCNRAVSSLKKICDEAVTYEVELLYLPDGIKIGDTISIVDDEDNTYLTARLLKLETSESNDTKEAELGDYVRQESGIDPKVIKLAEQFEKIAKNRNFYTWTAFADDENGTGISVNAYEKDYLGIATNRLTKEADISDPAQYTWVKIKGEQGIPGASGKDGADGKTPYFHVKYSAIENPTSYSDMTEKPDKYIGTYVDYELDDSTDPKKYTWSKFRGDNGKDGADGSPGKDAILISETEPETPEIGQLWQMATGEPIKRWNGSSWVTHYISVENLDVQTLSAICANLGTVIAGIIQNESESFLIDVANGCIESYGSGIKGYGIELNEGMLKFTNIVNDIKVALSSYMGLTMSNSGAGSEMSLIPYSKDWWIGEQHPADAESSAIPIRETLKKVDNKANKSWTLLKNQPTVGKSTITVDVSQYSEFLITCGLASSTNGNYYRELGSTIVPAAVLTSASGIDHGSGSHQAFYSSGYNGGISYLGSNKIKVYNNGGITRLYAR